MHQPRLIFELAKELNLPYSPDMQGWSYEVANQNDIEKYIEYYYRLDNEDKKFVVMEMIIQATVDQLNRSNFLKYWEKIKSILHNDFKIHEYTIYYWSNIRESNSKNCEFLSPLLEQ